MQLRFWVACTIFVGSYLPLAFILLAQDFNYELVDKELCIKFWIDGANCVLPFKHSAISLGLLSLCSVCFIMTLVVLSLAKAKRSININAAKYVPAELMNYTLPYVVSFMSFGYQDTAKFASVLIFLAWIFWITYKSGQVILNPLLIAFGWRLYDISYEFPGDNTKRQSTALSKGFIDADETYKYAFIQEVIVIRADVKK